MKSAAVSLLKFSFSPLRPMEHMYHCWSVILLASFLNVQRWLGYKAKVEVGSKALNQIQAHITKQMWVAVRLQKLCVSERVQKLRIKWPDHSLSLSRTGDKR